MGQFIPSLSEEIHCNWDRNLALGLLAAVWSHQSSLSPRPYGLCTSFILRFWRLTHVPTVIWPTLAPSAGAAGPRLFTIHQIDACTNNLPKAHTWWVTSVAFSPHARYIGVKFQTDLTFYLLFFLLNGPLKELLIIPFKWIKIIQKWVGKSLWVVFK